MAGTRNIYNAEPVEVLLEALRMATGVVFQRNYLTITAGPSSGTQTWIRFEPKLVNGFTPYTDAITLTVDKLNISAQIPKDMCYSGAWPVDFATMRLFMLNSYGMVIHEDEWEIVHAGTATTVRGDLHYQPSLSQDRMLYLRATEKHLLFVQGTSFPLFVTSPGT